MTLATMIFVGWLMMAGGVLETIHAFSCKAWSGFFIDLLAGILYVVVGFMIVVSPGASAVALTLLMALFLIFGGIFRIVVSLSVRYQHWVWLLAHGAINLLLGILIWRQWPLSGLWVIGLFIGIDMIFNGWCCHAGIGGQESAREPAGGLNNSSNASIAAEAQRRRRRGCEEDAPKKVPGSAATISLVESTENDCHEKPAALFCHTRTGTPRCAGRGAGPLAGCRPESCRLEGRSGDPRQCRGVGRGL